MVPNSRVGSNSYGYGGLTGGGFRSGSYGYSEFGGRSRSSGGFGQGLGGGLLLGYGLGEQRECKFSNIYKIAFVL